jgi:hypothetical protein
MLLHALFLIADAENACCFCHLYIRNKPVTAASAGHDLTGNCKRQLHYMTFSPTHSVPRTLWIASTPPERLSLFRLVRNTEKSVR